MTRDQTIAVAQRQADRMGKTLLVLNLNPFGSLWVIRDCEYPLVKEPGVWIVSPTVQS